MRAESGIQMDLFAAVTAAYAEDPAGVRNSTLYEKVSRTAGVAENEMEARVPIGKSGEMHSPMKRKIRWYQQTLKMLGVIERVEGERGVWRLAEKATKDLDRVTASVKLVAFSTDLGVAIWSRNQDVFKSLNEPIALCFTSPPYPLRQERSYGNPDHAKYVDFICDSIEPIVRSLVPGGSIVMNLSQDIFEPRSPARSLYLERLTLALHDRLGLSLMDRMPWVNFSKPPAPTYWACVNKLQLTTAYEPVLWFTNDPLRVRSNNQRVLEPHTERHQQLMAAGGAGRCATYGDGAYRLRNDSFGKVTVGKIPRNVIMRGHACADTKAYRQRAQQLGLPLHGAMQPTDIAGVQARPACGTSPGTTCYAETED